MAERILILGASARAAAASARRAGLEPFAIDLFADRDTRLLCDCLRCPPDEYPEGLFRRARLAPPMPWMYTGGLENYPELIDELAKERKLWGNHGRMIDNARNPYVLYSIFTAQGIAAPVVLPSGRPQPFSGKWVAKRFRGSGGSGITWYDYFADGWKGEYIQQFVPGTPMSAVFVCMPWRVELIAVTRQLVGERWLHAQRFAYCGSIGPLDLPGTTTDLLRRIGYVITQYALKLGLFGVDFVLEGESAYPIEVNPRYTASVEILDYAFKQPILTSHIDCASALDWEAQEPEDEHGTEQQGRTCYARQAVVGKAIYYTPHRLTFPAAGPWDDSLARAADVWHRPDFADIPHPGEVIEPGHPVLTILAEAADEGACLKQLQSQAAELDRLFAFTTPPETGPCPP